MNNIEIAMKKAQRMANDCRLAIYLVQRNNNIRIYRNKGVHRIMFTVRPEKQQISLPNIKQVRERKKMSQLKFSKLVKLNINVLRRLEAGKPCKLASIESSNLYKIIKEQKRGNKYVDLI